jgi:hypothetical protein
LVRRVGRSKDQAFRLGSPWPGNHVVGDGIDGDHDGMSCSMDMHGMGWMMMGGVGLFGLLLLVLLVLGVAALVKYLRR